MERLSEVGDPEYKPTDQVCIFPISNHCYSYYQKIATIDEFFRANESQSRYREQWQKVDRHRVDT